jgi:uncharacterized protein YecT (DUF1311 family)
MLAVVIGLLSSGVLQESATPQIGMAEVRPTRECAIHLTAPRARRNCMDNLLDEATESLVVAQQSARDDAIDVDVTTGGFLSAEQAFDDAQIAWAIYRDAECVRRSSLMMVADEAGAELVLDCRIVLTRARAAELRNN